MDEPQIISPVYRQKSRIFLWPLVGIARQVGFRPVKTFMADTKVSVEERCLIAPFPKDNSKNFGVFEEEVLLTNNFFSDFYETEDNLVYVFDLSYYSEDYDKIVKGRYSKLSLETKVLINKFYGTYTAGRLKPHFQVDAYLNPNEVIYSKLAVQLNVDINELYKTVEILDPPNIQKETFDEGKIKEERRSNYAKIPD